MRLQQTTSTHTQALVVSLHTPRAFAVESEPRAEPSSVPQSRAKPYLPQICGTIKWRLNNKSAKIRQQAADLIARIAVVMKACDEEKLLGHLGVVLYEYLGEEYPDVLGSILGALKAIVNVIGMTVCFRAEIESYWVHD